MTKTLIIAEKPSVALDISRALGGFTREGDYFESEQYVLASSIGHLLSLVAPNDPVRGKWSFAHLPVIPPQFELGPTDKRSAERLKLLIKLIKRKDVTQLINACDAGREGELIFRLIVQYAAGGKKPERPVLGQTAAEWIGRFREQNGRIAGTTAGLRGIRVDKPEDIGPAWDKALASDRPVILEAYTDPNVPTLPPHININMIELMPTCQGFSPFTIKRDLPG